MPNHLKKPSKLDQMPEYQIFPAGSWHLLAAVMLMIFAAAATLGLLSGLIHIWIKSDSALYLDMALLVTLALMIVVPTVALTRGYANCHRFLLAYNLALCVSLGVGIVDALANGDGISAAISGSGLVFGLLARKLYRSAALAQCVEHFRIIWTIYRARGRSPSNLD